MIELLKDSSVILCIFFMFILWLIIYKKFNDFTTKCMAIYSTSSLSIPEMNALFNSLTSGLFCLISVPLCFSTFKTTNHDSTFIFWILKSFSQILDECKTDEKVDPSRNFKFIIMYSCLLHSVYSSFSEFIIDDWPVLRTIKKVSILVFFASSYCFGCSEAGFIFLGLTNLSLGTLEAARLLKMYHNKTNSFIIKILSILQFIVHCGVWISIYLLIIPFTVISSIEVLSMEMNNKLPLGTMLLSLIVFYMIELRDSPLNMSTTSGNGIFRLLGSKSSKKLNITTKRPVDKSKENAMMLYQTTKCVMAMKKKIKKMRSDKESRELI
ncbi:uncharacterized protein LOC126903839 [Daktulosphaira vitifoliae]|uniref:uncharacterized protein LOC126903839 n=1 Tax=Daktulosphaira vitifoliae TaxID=58002 RepID=UPI0021AAF0AE|nr:uncharacterized protein LOC126903839 [Daktulosphaira vitifoliae]